ncbi:MAG: adenylate/guanylate cyclase domain-containing protein [Actinomycetes bacterium]
MSKKPKDQSDGVTDEQADLEPEAVAPESAPTTRQSRLQAAGAAEYLAHVLGGEYAYTADQVSEMAKVSIDEARTLWRAMGFPDVGSQEAFTKADVAALRTVRRLIDKDLLTFEQCVEIVRSLGQNTARLAEWQAATLSKALTEHGVVSSEGGLTEDEIPELIRNSKMIKPSLERLMVYAWRRQMAANITRAIEMDPVGESDAHHLSVGFADMVGFTRLSHRIGERDLGTLVEVFESGSADIVAETGARLVKAIGDEVLFVGPTADVVAETALRLHEAHRGEEEFPELRVGLATGSVVQRMGDVFGTTVNRASRLTVMARPNSTFTDSETMEMLAPFPQFSVKSVRPRTARGFGFMRAWSVTRA